MLTPCGTDHVRTYSRPFNMTHNPRLPPHTQYTRSLDRISTLTHTQSPNGNILAWYSVLVHSVLVSKQMRRFLHLHLALSPCHHSQHAVLVTFCNRINLFVEEVLDISVAVCDVLLRVFVLLLSLVR